ncbi:MAG: hypothetical protein IJQ88_11850 [Clostridia bacterium]|nr:hypothetical protein [Clostridia bacterium]
MSRTHEVVIYSGEVNQTPGIMTEIGIVEELATGKKVAGIVYSKTIREVALRKKAVSCL